MPQERSASCLTVTMITRFNAEYKERPKGKGKFTEERLGIGSASMMGVPYGIAGERFDISRTYYHELGKKADCVLENLRASGRTTERVIVLNKAFRERLVVALTCRGMSAAKIHRVCGRSFRVFHFRRNGMEYSKGSGRKAEATEKSVSPENVRHIATDEVFQNGEPVLTGVDLDAGMRSLRKPRRTGASGHGKRRWKKRKRGV